MRSRHPVRARGAGARVRAARSEIEVREATEADAPAILRGLARAFAAVDPGFRPRTPEAWRWRFPQNPHGWRGVVAVDARGEVLAQYAGSGMRVVGAEGERRASQAVDSFCVPQARGLGHLSLFARVGRAYAERYGGAGPDRDAFMWGLPVARALRVGRAHLGYEVVRTVEQHVADPHALPERAPLDPQGVEAFPAEAAELARQVAGNGLICARDAEWLAWRYRLNPQARYRAALVRDSGRLGGLAVLREGAFEGERGALLCEWLVPPGREEVERSLLAWARDFALERGLPRVVALVPDRSEAWIGLQRAGFRVLPTQYVLAARAYDRRFRRERLRAGWWWTLGDTDLA